MKAKIKKLKKENEIYRAGLDAVRQLIYESQGVTGLHFNGDLAPWDELMPGGEFEHWLSDYSEAIELMNKG